VLLGAILTGRDSFVYGWRCFVLKWQHKALIIPKELVYIAIRSSCNFSLIVLKLSKLHPFLVKKREGGRFGQSDIMLRT
jgi:hypothetical protein